MTFKLGMVLNLSLMSSLALAANASQWPVRIERVSAPVNATYFYGQSLIFAVHFSKPVIVTMTPRLHLSLDSGTRYASYISGSGTKSLLFRYNVQEADWDVDGVVVSSPLQLNGGSITSDQSNASIVFLSPVTRGVLVDGLISNTEVLPNSLP